MVAAIHVGEQSVPRASEGPESLSSRKWWFVSARTIFGRALHGVKRARPGERENANPTGQAIDEPSRAEAKTASLGGDPVDSVADANGEWQRPNKITTIAGRMANIALPHLRQIDESNVVPA